MVLLKGQKLLILRVLAKSGKSLTAKEILARDSEIAEAGVYVVLNRIDEESLVDSVKDEDTAGQRGSPHRRYKINDIGRSALKMLDDVKKAQRKRQR